MDNSWEASTKCTSPQDIIPDGSSATITENQRSTIPSLLKGTKSLHEASPDNLTTRNYSMRCIEDNSSQCEMKTGAVFQPIGQDHTMSLSHLINPLAKTEIEYEDGQAEQEGHESHTVDMEAKEIIMKLPNVWKSMESNETLSTVPTETFEREGVKSNLPTGDEFGEDEEQVVRQVEIGATSSNGGESSDGGYSDNGASKFPTSYTMLEGSRATANATDSFRGHEDDEASKHQIYSSSFLPQLCDTKVAAKSRRKRENEYEADIEVDVARKAIAQSERPVQLIHCINQNAEENEILMENQNEGSTRSGNAMLLNSSFNSAIMSALNSKNDYKGSTSVQATMKAHNPLGVQSTACGAKLKAYTKCNPMGSVVYQRSLQRQIECHLVYLAHLRSLHPYWASHQKSYLYHNCIIESAKSPADLCLYSIIFRQISLYRESECTQKYRGSYFPITLGPSAYLSFGSSTSLSNLIPPIIFYHILKQLDCLRSLADKNFSPISERDIINHFEAGNSHIPNYLPKLLSKKDKAGGDSGLSEGSSNFLFNVSYVEDTMQKMALHSQTALKRGEPREIGSAAACGARDSLRLEWSDGSKYEGEVTKTSFDGYGWYEFADGTTYEGQWKMNAMHGYGKLRIPQGYTYEGGFHSNKQHGRGCFTEPSGRRYYGNWQDGRLHGTAICVLPSYLLEFGQWLNGEFKNWFNGKSLSEVQRESGVYTAENCVLQQQNNDISLLSRRERGAIVPHSNHTNTLPPRKGIFNSKARGGKKNVVLTTHHNGKDYASHHCQRPLVKTVKTIKEDNIRDGAPSKPFKGAITSVKQKQLDEWEVAAKMLPHVPHVNYNRVLGRWYARIKDAHSGKRLWKGYTCGIHGFMKARDMAIERLRNVPGSWAEPSPETKIINSLVEGGGAANAGGKSRVKESINQSTQPLSARSSGQREAATRLKTEFLRRKQSSGENFNDSTAARGRGATSFHAIAHKPGDGEMMKCSSIVERISSTGDSFDRGGSHNMEGSNFYGNVKGIPNSQSSSAAQPANRKGYQHIIIGNPSIDIAKIIETNDEEILSKASSDDLLYVARQLEHFTGVYFNPKCRAWMAYYNQSTKGSRDSRKQRFIKQFLVSQCGFFGGRNAAIKKRRTWEGSHGGYGGMGTMFSIGEGSTKQQKGATDSEDENYKSKIFLSQAAAESQGQAGAGAEVQPVLKQEDGMSNFEDDNIDAFDDSPRINDHQDLLTSSDRGELDRYGMHPSNYQGISEGQMQEGHSTNSTPCRPNPRRNGKKSYYTKGSFVMEGASEENGDPMQLLHEVTSRNFLAMPRDIRDGMHDAHHHSNLAISEGIQDTVGEDFRGSDTKSITHGSHAVTSKRHNSAINFKVKKKTRRAIANKDFVGTRHDQWGKGWRCVWKDENGAQKSKFFGESKWGKDICKKMAEDLMNEIMRERGLHVSNIGGGAKQNEDSVERDNEGGYKADEEEDEEVETIGEGVDERF